MVDLTKITTLDAFEKPSEMVLLDPHSNKKIKGDDGKDITFLLHHQISKVSEEAINEGKKIEGITPLEKNCLWFSRVCVGWSDNWSYGKSKLEFSQENALELAEKQPFILGQAMMHTKKSESYRPKFGKS